MLNLTSADLTHLSYSKALGWAEANAKESQEGLCLWKTVLITPNLGLQVPSLLAQVLTQLLHSDPVKYVISHWPALRTQEAHTMGRDKGLATEPGLRTLCKS